MLPGRTTTNPVPRCSSRRSDWRAQIEMRLCDRSVVVETWSFVTSASGPMPDVNAPPTRGRPPPLLVDRPADHPEGELAVDLERDVRPPRGLAVDEVERPVDRIDDPAPVAVPRARRSPR